MTTCHLLFAHGNETKERQTKFSSTWIKRKPKRNQYKINIGTDSQELLLLLLLRTVATIRETAAAASESISFRIDLNVVWITVKRQVPNVHMLVAGPHRSGSRNADSRPVGSASKALCSDEQRLTSIQCTLKRIQQWKWPLRALRRVLVGVHR